ncbi:distal tail protein Dit [Halobacillus salinus]|uniref:distal tail protein Dit n=1 Tax=Halobacillus salinus TaxID=192814 RepID=UPI0009A5C255|nr:distal tail protein Dit [Halobacillus salinus]
MNLTFNSIRKPWIYLLEGRTKPPFAAIKRNTLAIPGRKGLYLQSSDKSAMIIQQPVGFKVNSNQHALQLKDELARWLITEEEVPLELEDEPGRQYMAVVNNTIEDLERFVDQRKGTIQFLCLDPDAYGETIPHDYDQNPLIFNEGTAETYPVIECEVTEAMTRLEVTNRTITDQAGRNPSVILGRDKSLEQEAFQKEELVFHDTMQDENTWTEATEVDNGEIAGEIGVDEKGFYPALYGGAIQPYNWQGPSKIKGIGDSLQDFRADILVENLNTAAETGMLAVYFRDANLNKIANVGFGDAWQGKAENFGHGQLGNYNSGPRKDAYADHQYGWNNFDGIIRVTRVDNVWRFYYARIEADGSHNWVHSRSRITDNALNYMAPFTDIQVAFRLWPLTERTDIHIKDIKVFRINKPNSPSQIPIIAEPGDKLTINMATGLIEKNGEPQITLAGPVSQMFPLIPGYNHLNVVTNGKVNTTVKYTLAYA